MFVCDLNFIAKDTNNISYTVKYGLGGHSRPKHATKQAESYTYIYMYIYMCIYIYISIERERERSSMNTVLFVNATIGFSENLFLVLSDTALA